MTTMQLMEIVTEAIRQLDGQPGITVPAQINRDTVLFGKEGLLDSMALVTLVVAVEQAIEDQFGTSISLADARAMSQKHSPYRTIGSLVDYADKVIKES